MWFPRPGVGVQVKSQKESYRMDKACPHERGYGIGPGAGMGLMEFDVYQIGMGLCIMR